MLKITLKQQRSLKMIVGYLKAGGDMNMKFITDFCKEAGVTPKDLQAYVAETGPDYVAALHKFGFL